MESDSTYKYITKEILDPHEESRYLNKAAILGKMIDKLPQAAWAKMEILEWISDDDNLKVEYHRYDSPFGEVLIANTPKGVCYLGVVNKDSGYVIKDFTKRFGYAKPQIAKTTLQKIALDYLNGKKDVFLPFHLRGTTYQTAIWKRLLLIPFGKVISYATLAQNKEYARAAGTANGRNPIFYLVPCHRVVCTNGKFDRYSWGKNIKKRLLAWEFETNKA